MTSRDTTSSTNSDVRRAWRALCELKGVRDLPSKAPSSTDAVTELLFDHVLRFDSSRFLYLLTNLQIDRMDIAARSFCAERALLLDPALLAEETLCVLFQQTVQGVRKKPFADWARAAMEDAANDAIDQPELAPPHELGKTPVDRRIVRELAHLVNRLELRARRIAWQHLVEGADARSISDATGQPFEYVEFVLARHVDPTRRTLESRRSSKRPRRSDEDRSSA